MNPRKSENAEMLEFATPRTAGRPQASLQAETGRARLGVIVAGADYRALGAVRSLGRRGIPVVVLRQGGHSLAALSRFAQRSFQWPDGDDAERIARLIQLARVEKIQDWMLIPSDDDTAVLIARHHDELVKHFRLTTPDWEHIRLATDKQCMYQLAESIDIPQPWTCFPTSREELALAGNRFPAILKPITRVGMLGVTNTKAWRVDDASSLQERYGELSQLAGGSAFMVQELIPGDGECQYSFAALCRAGEVLAGVTARRGRQIPADFGRFSTFVETVDQPELAVVSSCLLRAMNFTGLVEVEFKRDPRDGDFKLLDVNPRLWGWHSVCARAGVDFPYLLWRDVQAMPLPETRPQTGVRWSRIVPDLMVAVPEILGGRLGLGAYMKSLRGPRESAIFAADDPVPGLCEFPLTVFTGVLRKFQRCKKTS